MLLIIINIANVLEHMLASFSPIINYRNKHFMETMVYINKYSSVLKAFTQIKNTYIPTYMYAGT